MNNLVLAETVKGCITAGASALGAVATSIISGLFVTKNIERQEIAKIKAGKLVKTLDDLLDKGKITYLEYYKCNNAMKIANLADDFLLKHNIEDSHVEENAERYNFDWFMKFYEYSGYVSEKQAQELWASVLAKEIEKPGAIPLSLLHCLSIIEHHEAELFCNISRFSFCDFVDNSPHLLLFVATNRQAYKSSGITPEGLKSLERLGLIECDFTNEYVFNHKKIFKVGNHSIQVFGDPENHKKIKAGNAIFTPNGKILYTIIDDKYKQYNSMIVDFTVSEFIAKKCKVSIDEKPMIQYNIFDLDLMEVTMKKTNFRTRIISMLLFVAIIVSAIPLSIVSVSAAENIDYIDDGDFDLLGYGYNALKGTEISSTTITTAVNGVGALIDRNKAEGYKMNVNTTSGVVHTYDSMTKLLHSFGIDFSRTSTASANIGIAKAGMEKKFDLNFDISHESVYQASFLTYTVSAIRNQYVLSSDYTNMLSDDFLEALKTDSVEAIFAKYGTHMLVFYQNGGRADLTAYAYSKDENTKLDANLGYSSSASGEIGDSSMGASASVANKIAVDFNFEKDESKVSSDVRWNLIGGNATYLAVEKKANGSVLSMNLDQSSLNSWTESVNDNAVMIPETTEWVPIWEILPDTDEYLEIKAELYQYFMEKADSVNSEFFKKYCYYTGSGTSSGYTYINSNGYVFPNTVYDAVVSNNKVAPGSTVIPEIDDKFFADCNELDYEVAYKIIGDATVDATNGIFKVSDNPTTDTITLELYVNGNYRNKMEFIVADEGDVNGNDWFAGGYGTPERPYLISTPEQFMNLSNEVCYSNEKYYFQLTNDLDFSTITTEKPITNFFGHLDGNGYAIQNWSYSENNVATTTYYCGIFAQNNGTLRNMRVINSTLDLSVDLQSKVICYIGMFCGLNQGRMENITIYDSDIKGSCVLAMPFISTVTHCGILSGASSGHTENPTTDFGPYIKKCGVVSSEINIEVTSGSASPLSGALLNNGLIEECYSCENNIYAYSPNPMMGGIVGMLNGEIKNCVSFNNTLDSSFLDMYLGEFVGNYKSGSILNCYTTSSAGDLIGYGEYSIPNVDKCKTYAGNILALSGFSSTEWKDDGYKPELIQANGLSANASKMNTNFVFNGEADYIDFSKLSLDYAANPLSTSKVYWMDIDSVNYSAKGSKDILVKGYAGQTATFAIDGVDKKAEKIEIESMPKTTYFESETLSIDGIRVTVYYNDGSTEIVDEATITSSNIKNFSTSLTDGNAISEVKEITVDYLGCEDTYDITVYKIVPQSLTITNLPKLNYYSGQAFDFSGITLELLKNNGEKVQITSNELTNSNFTGFDNSTTAAQTQTITVTHSGLSATYEIHMTKDEIASVSLKSAPTKTVYYVGDYENLDTAGLVLHIKYTSGKEEDISSGYSCSDLSTDIAGTKKITVNYYGFTVDFPIEVRAIEVTSIAIAPESAHKVSYFIGDIYSSSGIALDVTYNNGKTATVWSGYSWKVTGYDENATPNLVSAGTKAVTLYYSVGGVRKQTSYDININPVIIEDIEISQYPTQQYYILGETFNDSGMTVIANKNNGISEIIVPDSVVYDFSVAGQRTVTVGYLGHTVEFDVTVLAPSSISIKQAPNKVQYEEGEIFTKEGLIVQANYANGKIRELLATEYVVSEPDTTSAGTKKVTISAFGLTTSYDILVYKHAVTTNDPQIIVGQDSARAGETVKLDITMKNVTALKSILLDQFDYDKTKLELVGFEWKLNGAVLSDWDSTEEVATIAFNQNVDANGVVAELTFKVLEDTEVGNISVSCTIAANEKLTAGGEAAVTIYVVDGCVTVTTIVRGDVNGDDFLDSDDAIYLLRSTLNPNRYPSNQNGDMNGDGFTDSDDAIYLLRHTLSPSRYPLS